MDKKQTKRELCYDGSSNHRPDDCHCRSFICASQQVCRRRRKMVAPTADTVLFVLFVPSHSLCKLCMHYPDYPAPQSPVPEFHNITICIKALLILSLVSSPGVLFVRLGLLPPIIMLPISIQLHHEPAGFLLPAAARDSGVCHYDSPRHGGTS